MANKTPAFWWKKHSLLSWLLSPCAFIYGYVAKRRMEKALPSKVTVPVLCIGNFTLGGTGKTPLAIAFAQAAKKKGFNAGIVSRGYGGSISKKGQLVHIIDKEKDTADKVGDEPLLLAQHAPVAISVNRHLAAKELQKQGVNFIIMDDGFQSRRLYMDYALLTIDTMRGVGNGKCFPAGPMRAPLNTQLEFTDSILLIGQKPISDDRKKTLFPKTIKPVHQAVWQSTISFCKLESTKKPIKTLADIRKQRFLAFAGIGNPEKFYDSISALNGIIVQKIDFADHHFFTNEDVENIVQIAKQNNLIMITTAKDYVRLKAHNLDKKINNLLVLDVELKFLTKDFCSSILQYVSLIHKR